jgi:serine/threonine-protein kinase
MTTLARATTVTTVLAARAGPTAATTATAVDVAPSRLSDAAYRKSQAKRLRLTVLFSSVVCAGGLLGIQVIGGDPIARAVHSAGLGLGLIGSLWAFFMLRDLDNYTPIYGAVLSHIAAIGTGTAFYFWGPFSGALMIVPGAALLLAQVVRGRTLLVALNFMGIHAAITALIVFGVIEERAFTPIAAAPIGVQLVRLALVQLIMASAFLIAVRISAAYHQSLCELDEALRAVAQRDALLAEAERARAEVLGVGVPGRYTDQVLGSYRLGLVIGRGGLGVVYDAAHTDTGEPAAVKVLHPHILARPDQFRRFARELRVAAGLSGPNLVEVFETPDADDGFPYLAMERLVGESLADYLSGGRRLEPAEVVEMVGEVAAGLEIAHAAGVVHRDIKPSNLFRLEFPAGGARWKILDFGTCREIGGGSTVTEMGLVLGTPGYMAPEQARGNRVDARADVYALAAVAYRALTGQPAFANRELPRLLHDVAYSMPPRPSDLAATGDDVDGVLAIGLAKRPYQRFDSAVDFAAALGAAVAGELDPAVRGRGLSLQADRSWGVAFASL